MLNISDVVFREIAAYNELLQSLSVIGSCLVENHNKSDGTGLFSEEGIRENAVRKAMDVINLEVFYGRFLGFNVCLSKGQRS